MDITKRLNIDKHRCPWQSIHFITDDVPDDLRKDLLLSSRELFEIDFTPIFNEFKSTYYKKYLKRKITDVEKSIDPTKLTYDGWEVMKHYTYQNAKLRDVWPFRTGFVTAKKQIIPGLWAVSVAITISAH